MRACTIKSLSATVLAMVNPRRELVLQPLTPDCTDNAEYMAVADDEDNGMYFDLDAADNSRLAVNPEYEEGVSQDPDYAQAATEPMYFDAASEPKGLEPFSVRAPVGSFGAHFIEMVAFSGHASRAAGGL